LAHGDFVSLLVALENGLGFLGLVAAAAVTLGSWVSIPGQTFLCPVADGQASLAQGFF
jgi:hypothetical protein